LTIPGAMSPTEIFKMFEMGADIVKVFPANCLGPEYFNQVQAPLGSLPLMAVGGVDQTNAQNYLNNGASYVGIGSKFFEKSAVHQLNYERLMELAESFIDSLRVE
ncbi:TPA: bifunctional 4-hydroxy-2-oxoglutarate aldolase/2-dehydro-3-deoxy-phosphogluconate aldolase, partial [Enterococcus faecium]|nr:2-dehydro-3-deoxyphosphogluconate aldolase [Enterococcus faecium]HAQ1583889.1 2-dehydro-3-deoxyphosphogluconate aldolase [Enterococcus faecium Efm-HS0661]EKQ3704442.1 2-dehydro-3-deoxyphosphogluconate aldolase [Enterococcus faecium]MBJ1573764.1 2-dehydro-3-deoxyphosphogluconate aldolase [Enterococcus faecium]MBT1038747.1 2-dehydro-3-deoxyphosphogluconate aldolase [Enterococcus faecium]